MLADSAETPAYSGSLGKEIHLPAESRHRLLDFIADELPRWRDSADRPAATSETTLTSQLCEHLNSAARLSVGWDFLQFRTETGDEVNKGRKIDLVPKPCATTVWIEGRKHTHYDALLPIECKRLPTPKEADRDEREYVINQHATTGGIQRFKAGHHGSGHGIGAMIGYVQSEDLTKWHTQVISWINDLAASGQTGWSKNDALSALQSNSTARISRCNSTHARNGSLTDIELQHLWIMMN